MSAPWLFVVGIGEDGVAGLSPGPGRWWRTPRCWWEVRAIWPWFRTAHRSG